MIKISQNITTWYNIKYQHHAANCQYYKTIITHCEIHSTINMFGSLFYKYIYFHMRQINKNTTNKTGYKMRSNEKYNRKTLKWGNQNVL